MTENFLIPTSGRIIVREDPFKYEGLIKIPDTAKRRPTTGVVVAVGKYVDEAAVGDRVVFAQMSGTLIQFKDQPAFRVLVQDEILAKVVGENLELEGTVA
jgi:co-chaperonin GroES (HSP10)